MLLFLCLLHFSPPPLLTPPPPPPPPPPLLTPHSFLLPLSSFFLHSSASLLNSLLPTSSLYSPSSSPPSFLSLLLPPSRPSPSLPSPPAGVDYEPLIDFQFTMSRDQTSAQIPVTLINDTAFELRELFLASLSPVSPLSSRITIAPDAANVTIDDDDSELYSVSIQK